MELKLGSIPLKVQGSFLIMALLLGLHERDPVRLAIWVAIVLVSVVLHELGHALMGKAFGLEPRIELYGMGGMTYFGGGRAELSTGKSIAISLAGPFAGFLFAGIVLAAQIGGFQPIHPLARFAVTYLLWVNLAWGVFNLLPMLPLDGGNVLRAGASAITKEHGEKIARVLSLLIALGLGVWAIGSKQWWVLYLSALFGFQNFQALRQSGQLRKDQALADAIKKGYAALDRGSPKDAAAELSPALATDASSDLRQVGLRIFVVALLKEAKWSDALAVIERERAVIGGEDLGRFAQMLRDLGREEEATRVDALGAAPAPMSEFRA